MPSTNPEVLARAKRKYRATEKGKATERAHRRKWREAGNARRYQERIQVALKEFKESVGCAACGYKENGDAMEFDHIVGGGKPRRGKWTWKLFEMFTTHPNIQVLCGNCHNIKSRAAQRRRVP